MIDNTIFISYAKEDVETARIVCQNLKNAGMEPWFDEISLLPGHNWKLEIKSAIKKSRYFLALLSKNSVNHKGFVNKEIAEAIEIVHEYPDSSIFIIPVRIDNCKPSHEKLSELNWVYLFPSFEKGMKKIFLALNLKNKKLTNNKSNNMIKKVMISSSLSNFPQHREKALDACIRQGMLPMNIEFFPASNENLISLIKQKIIDADIFIGIYTNQYGFIPEGYNMSISEIEYRQAVKIDIPTLIFLMHKDHPIKINDIDLGIGVERIKKLLIELESKHTINYFKSPDELQYLLINSLSYYK